MIDTSRHIGTTLAQVLRYTTIVPLLLVAATYVLSAQQPQLQEVDWGEQWVINACSKNTAAEYSGAVAVQYQNPSSSILVQRVELIGADYDNGYFGFTQPPPIIGTELDSQIVNELSVEVFFRPQVEGRNYSAVFRMVYQILPSGRIDSVQTNVKGTGIETHLYIPQLQMDSAIDARPIIRKSIEIQATGTRPLTITGIMIEGRDAVDFLIDVKNIPAPYNALPQDNPSAWANLPSGTIISIPIIFSPLSAGQKEAELRIEGSFTRCEDSVGILTGISTVSTFQTVGYTFGTVLTCDQASGTIRISNNGADTMNVTDIFLETGNIAEFVLQPFSLPARLVPGDNVNVPIIFSPVQAIDYTAVVRINGVTQQNNITVSQTAQLMGAGATLAMALAIPDTITGITPQSVSIPVELRAPFSGVDINDLLFSISYDSTAISIVDIVPGCGLLADVTPVITKNTSGLLELLYPIGGEINSIPAGVLFCLQGTILESDEVCINLPFSVSFNNLPCVSVTVEPGKLCITPVGVVEGIEIRPNPTIDVVNIRVGLEEEADVSVEIYTSAGRLIARPFTGQLGSGRHSVEWDASDYAAGTYYCIVHVAGRTVNVPIIVLGNRD